MMNKYYDKVICIYKWIRKYYKISFVWKLRNKHGMIKSKAIDLTS